MIIIKWTILVIGIRFLKRNYNKYGMNLKDVLFTVVQLGYCLQISVALTILVILLYQAQYTPHLLCSYYTNAVIHYNQLFPTVIIIMIH